MLKSIISSLYSNKYTKFLLLLSIGILYILSVVLLLSSIIYALLFLFNITIPFNHIVLTSMVYLVFGTVITKVYKKYVRLNK